jgi:hypothetical protein
VWSDRVSSGVKLSNFGNAKEMLQDVLQYKGATQAKPGSMNQQLAS